MIEGYWRIGAKFIEYEATGKIKRERGQETVKKIAGKLNLWYTNLYAAIKFAELYPTMAEVRFICRDKFGDSPSWTAIKTQVLPKNAGLPRDDQHHEVLSEAERAAEKLERISGELVVLAADATEDEIEAIQNVQAEVAVISAQAGKALKRAQDVLAFPKESREVDSEYLAWLHQQDDVCCILTGDLDWNACHLRSRGAQGSDYWVFPLTHALHMESHADPAFFYRHRQMIAEWFYRLPSIHARYLDGTGQKEELDTSRMATRDQAQPQGGGSSDDPQPQEAVALTVQVR
tara:strand:- start:609 stop:1478 length:870 start_codon:yes stop_codon:yes gene_type:complete